MVKCKYCDYDNPKDASFCINCSKELRSEKSEDKTFLKEDKIKNLEEQETDDFKNLYYALYPEKELEFEEKQIDTSKGHNDNNIKIDENQELNNKSSNVYVAVFLSFIISGAGYLYIQDLSKGITFLVGQILLLAVAYFTNMIHHVFVGVCFDIAIFLYLYQIYGTYKECTK